jgi:hypothetical protein
MKHALAVLLLLTSPAIADECAYVDGDGWRATLEGESERTMTVRDPTGASELRCRLVNEEANTGAFAFATCDGGIVSVVEFSGDHASYDVMQFRGRTFYLTCWGANA